VKSSLNSVCAILSTLGDRATVVLQVALRGDQLPGFVRTRSALAYA
jgi:hypothetical protein